MIERALLALAPNALWEIVEGVLIWKSPEIPQPTQAQIDAKIAELAAIIPPNPLGFRDKLYGLKDPSPANTLFHQVYVPNTQAATNPGTANAALTEARNILEGSLWNEPFSKAAFFNQFGSGSFNILSNFLSPEQIDLFESEARAFGLID